MSDTAPPRRFSRRTALTGSLTAVAVAVTVGLAGCGSGGDGAAPSSSAAGGFPVTVTTSNGEVTIPRAPTRVVALGNAGFENVLALGITPVAAGVKDIGALPYLSEHANDPAIDPKLGDYMTVGVELEVLAGHRPDLIVAPAWSNFLKHAEQLNKIAPTVFFDALGTTPDWRAGVKQVGAALGKPAAADRLVADAEAKYRGLAERNPALANADYGFGLVRNGAVALGTGGALLRLTGMKPAAAQAETEQSKKPTQYSAERIADLQGSVLLLMARPQSERAVVEATPVWSTIAPRVLWLTDPQGEAINNGGVLAKTWLPGSLEPELARITG